MRPSFGLGARFNIQHNQRADHGFAILAQKRTGYHNARIFLHISQMVGPVCQTQDLGFRVDPCKSNKT